MNEKSGNKIYATIAVAIVVIAILIYVTMSPGIFNIAISSAAFDFSSPQNALQTIIIQYQTSFSIVYAYIFKTPYFILAIIGLIGVSIYLYYQSKTSKK